MSRPRDPWEEFYARSFERDDRRNVRAIVLGTIAALVVVEAAVLVFHPPLWLVFPLSLGLGLASSRAGLALARRTRSRR